MVQAPNTGNPHFLTVDHIPVAIQFDAAVRRDHSGAGVGLEYTHAASLPRDHDSAEAEIQRSPLYFIILSIKSVTNEHII